ncbi:hypothetical protein NDU88_004638 [Pleurodeles waltl]|uniref:Uncharacterized protein n=1 Tax=Pleurodeles waltl TaxID=8319 RepID=A0AAV7W8Q8_PLEWA|nr:hypothetical protein NDU88_004638 [Pleurodeles waltl]
MELQSAMITVRRGSNGAVVGVVDGRADDTALRGIFVDGAAEGAAPGIRVVNDEIVIRDGLVVVHDGVVPTVFVDNAAASSS